MRLHITSIPNNPSYVQPASGFLPYTWWTELAPSEK